MHKHTLHQNLISKSKALIFISVASLTLWGCGLTPSSTDVNKNTSNNTSNENTHEQNTEMELPEEQNQEPAPEVPTKEAPTKTVSLDMAGTSHPGSTKTIRVEGDSVFASKPTYLSGIILTGQITPNCMMFGDGIVKSEEILKTDPSQVLLEELIADPAERQSFINEMKTRFDKKYELLKVCKESKNTYALFAEPGGRGLIVSVWNKEKELLNEFDKVNISDYAHDFIPDVAEGKSIIAAPYGDAGHMFWRFYLLDNSTMKTDKIEDCEGEFVDSSTPLEFKYSCKLEYTPSH